MNTITRAAIVAFVTLWGHGETFDRVKNEIIRTNEAMPDATGADKRDKVLADLAIIFNDVVEPIAESVMRTLLELGVLWLKSKV